MKKTALAAVFSAMLTMSVAAQDGSGSMDFGAWERQIAKLEASVVDANSRTNGVADMEARFALAAIDRLSLALARLDLYRTQRNLDTFLAETTRAQTAIARFQKAAEGN